VSPKLATDVASLVSSERVYQYHIQYLTRHPPARVDRRHRSQKETMHVLAAIGCFALGCVIAAALPRPLEQDKRVWHREHKAAKPTRDGPRRVGRRH